MSVYKVPQDVEADDKLLGPFSFRQFIYLMVAAGLAAIAVFLFQIFPGLIVIPAPFLIFFVVLALPLRKDQPMEVYLAAVLSFHLKPRKRLWQPDGIEHLIEISAPVNTDENLTKNIGRDEASRRFSYLADIVDTGGWAIKNAVSQDSNLHNDIVAESRNANDIFEDRASRIDSMLKNTNDFRKQQIIRNMNTARNLADYTNSSADQIQTQTFSAPNATDLYADSLERAQIQQQNAFLSWNQPTQQPAQNQQFSNQPAQNFQQNQTSYFSNPQVQSFENPVQTNHNQDDLENIQLSYNPYPNSMKQSVVSPNGHQPINSAPTVQQPIQAPQIPQQPPQEPIKEEVSPEIMRLVSEGKDLSVETIARQAQKIKEKQAEIDLKNNDEVIISLR